MSSPSRSPRSPVPVARRSAPEAASESAPESAPTHSPETAARGLRQRLAQWLRVDPAEPVDGLKQKAAKVLAWLGHQASRLAGRQAEQAAAKEAEAQAVAKVQAAEQAAAKAKAKAQREVAALAEIRARPHVAEVVERQIAARADAKPQNHRAGQERPEGSKGERKKGKKPTPEQVKARAAEAAATSNERLQVLREVAARPVPWTAGHDAPGTLDQPIQTGRGAWIVGATGALADADLSTPEGRDAAIQWMESRTAPSTGKAGRPPEEFGHLVAPIPHGPDGRPIREWTPQTAQRIGRQMMLATGADPDQHDALFVRHSKQATKGHAAEECLHVVFCRRSNTNGMLLDNDHEWTSLAIGQIRWRQAAGVPSSEAGATSSGSRAIHDSFKDLAKGRLYARYKGKSAGLDRSADVGIDLIGEKWRERIGAEGMPMAGVGHGELWLSKPKTRDVRGLTEYLFRGA